MNEKQQAYLDKDIAFLEQRILDLEAGKHFFLYTSRFSSMKIFEAQVLISVLSALAQDHNIHMVKLHPTSSNVQINIQFTFTTNRPIMFSVVDSYLRGHYRAIHFRKDQQVMIEWEYSAD